MQAKQVELSRKSRVFQGKANGGRLKACVPLPQELIEGQIGHHLDDAAEDVDACRGL